VREQDCEGVFEERGAELVQGRESVDGGSIRGVEGLGDEE